MSFPSYVYVPGQKTVNGDPVFTGDARDCSDFNTRIWLYYDAPFTSLCFHRYAPDGSTLPPPPSPYYLHKLDGSVDGYMHFPAGTSPYGQYLNPAIIPYVNPADWVTPQALADKAKMQYGTDADGAVPTSTAAAVVTKTRSATTAQKVAATAVDDVAPATPGTSIWDKLVNTFTGGETSPSVVAPEDRFSGQFAAIPTWAWVAGGAAALYFLSGRNK